MKNHCWRILAIMIITGVIAFTCENEMSSPTVLGAVTNFTAIPGDGRVELSWAAPQDNGGAAISRYEVSSDNGAQWVTASSATSHTFTGLTNGEPYTFRVRAVNAAGAGAESMQIVTPTAGGGGPSVPGPVTGIQSFADDSRVLLWWDPPENNGGAPIIRYEVSSDNGNSWITAVGTPTFDRQHDFTDLTNGMEYTFRVRAVNAVGAGAESWHTATPTAEGGGPSVPGPVSFFQAVQGDGEVFLYWGAPANNGGLPITHYEVSSGTEWVTAMDITGTATSLQHTFTGLTNGVEYTFGVRAVNDIGEGAERTQTATPIAGGTGPTVPGLVSGFQSYSDNNRIILWWDYPANNGGSAITHFEVSGNNGNTWVTVNDTTYDFVDLSNGVQYTFGVRAFNEVGAGAESWLTATPFTTPGQVTNFTATPGNGQVVLSWDAPANNGGSPITRYEVSNDNGTSWVAASSTSGHTFTGLTNGVQYIFRVRAFSEAGPGAQSSQAATPAAPATVPETVTNFITTPGDGQVFLSWTAPASDGGSAISHYQVQRNNEAWITASSNTGHTFTGLTNGTQYTFRVRAANGIGTGAESEQTATPVSGSTVPGPVSNFNTSPGNGQVVLSWTAPASDGGSPITRYEVQRNNEAWITASSNTGHTFTGLTNGTQYTFRVRAVNGIGTGPASSQTATPAAPATTPGQVASFTATPGSSRVELSWTAPASDGGSPITRYEVSNDNGNSWVNAWSATSYTFFSLTNGTLYTFRVRAVNAIGTGPASTTTATPATTPGLVTNLTATAGTGQVVLSWSAPTSNGGSPITHYDVSSNDGDSWVTASSATGHTFTGLTNGTQYTFRVRAVNAAGAGGSLFRTATPATTPGQVRNFTATRNSDTWVTLSWEAPASNGGSAITLYEISRDNGASWVTTFSTSTSYSFYSLTAGETHTFRIRAVNAIGTGPESSQTITLTVVPGAVSSLTATPGSGQIAVSWAVPANNGGSPITHYEVQCNWGEWVSATGTTSHTITHLNNGTTYYIYVRAVNAVGAGPSSTIQAATAAGGAVPGAVSSFMATPGNGRAVLSWTAPANNGGSAIVRYEVREGFGGTWVTAASANSHTFTGLTNGTSYRFWVRAVNATGSGVESEQYATPAAGGSEPTVPSVPQNFTATPGDSQVALSWTAPADNGGSAIIRYEARRGNEPWVTASSNTGHTFTGLTNGTSYFFDVRAVNTIGAGDMSMLTATPAATPTVTLNPTSVTIDNGNLTRTVSVGGTATGTITLNTSALPSGVTATISGTTITVTGVRPSTQNGSINNSYTVGVTRESVTQYLTVAVNLTTTWFTPLQMVQIPAGTFTMGSPTTETGRSPNESPQRQVTLSAFSMSAYQITQEQWAVVMEGNTNDISTNPSWFNGDANRVPAAGEVQGRRPVENVSWYDVLVFANRLSIMEGLSPAYRVNGSTNPDDWGTVPTSNNTTWNAEEIITGSLGYRLPTEAQWEYACRAETTTAFNNGTQNFNDQTALNPIGWFTFNSNSRTHEVGKKAANAWGLYDMHGNVSEWCWDWRGDYPDDAVTDPVGPSSGTYRVNRGGEWSSSAQYARSAYRESARPIGTGSYLGFRLVLSYGNIPNVTISTNSVTINNSNLTQTVSVGGTVSGTVTLTTSSLPSYGLVSATVSGTTITVTGIRPSIGSLTGTYTITVRRGGLTQNLSVEINLTPTGSPSSPNIQMVPIPAGTFTMGSSLGEIGRNSNESPQRQVTLSAFNMGAYQITQEQWAAVMTGNTNGISANPSYFHGGPGRTPTPGETQVKRPVESISWYEALVFANRLSIIEGLTPAYRINDKTHPDAWGTVPTTNNETWNAVGIVPLSNGYRLPTEAQWEYACRAGQPNAFNNGVQEWNNQALLGGIGWFDFNSGERTHEVGIKAANTWELFDMHGNVAEWCWDWYGSYPNNAESNPTGPYSGTNRVFRGGYWPYSAQYARSASRDFQPTHYFFNFVGLRIVRP